MHGHCAPLPPGRPVLRRRSLLSLARWWPTTAGLTGPFVRIYPETRPCALVVGCWCGVVWCGVVWCGVVWCGVVWCGVVWCGVVWCGVVWCGVVWCGVVSKALLPNGKRPGCLPKGKGKRAGLCVLCARRVRVCGSWAERGGDWKNLAGTSVAAVVIPGAPTAPPLFPLVGAGAAPATPTPLCCPGPSGPSAMWRAPSRERTRP